MGAFTPSAILTDEDMNKHNIPERERLSYLKITYHDNDFLISYPSLRTLSNKLSSSNDLLDFELTTLSYALNVHDLEVFARYKKLFTNLNTHYCFDFIDIKENSDEKSAHLFDIILTQNKSDTPDTIEDLSHRIMSAMNQGARDVLYHIALPKTSHFNTLLSVKNSSLLSIRSEGMGNTYLTEKEVDDMTRDIETYIASGFLVDVAHLKRLLSSLQSREIIYSMHQDCLYMHNTIECLLSSGATMHYDNVVNIINKSSNIAKAKILSI